MATKKAKSSKKQVKTNSKCFVSYTEDSSPRAKMFDSEKQLKAFMKAFKTKYGDDMDGGNWLDICVTGVTGDVTNLDPYHNPFDET